MQKRHSKIVQPLQFFWYSTLRNQMLFMVKLAEKHFYMFIIKGLFQCLLVEVMFGAIKLIFVAKYSLF